CQQYSALPWTF
nr:immunoglobulin light chain junction region [Macaca mulatta]MOV74468.1 immunoglobulin light chain junction region [Macaca mulatta]MOV75102.1 immunoglobulin light chain junction region [Macaca mulatta]MOV75228.1 immunoglobulin light chain junction region [Macaca mulatta]MOV75733.1 immunoglobulin light chain junction region [Macaca mulatta]